MRVRLTAAVALLVMLALGGAGLIVYVIETQRVDANTVREVEQELDEFALLVDEGIDPSTGEPFENLRALLELFIERNVPDDDELLVGWIGDRPQLRLPRDPLPGEAPFQQATRPLIDSGGTTRIDTDRGEVLIASQPVELGGDTGALVVASFLAEDQSELLDTMRTYVIVALLSLLLITAMAFWQAGRLLAPLRVLRDTAESIGETDLSRRITETGNDDLTALTRTVNRMLDRLESAFIGQRQFLDDAGHELKTPLTVLRGHLELLDAGDPVETEETRELLLDEVDRMSRLVGELILLAKTDRPDFLSLDAVDVTRLTEAVLAKARVMGERSWTLDHVPDPTLDVAVDEQRITQALLQLADNAVKHTTTGDEIGLGSSYDGLHVQLWVRDTGPGVPLADHDRIFERFGRSAIGEADEGFGLGLSIVGAIARAHGGDVRLDHTYVDGARFVIALPITHEEH